MASSEPKVATNIANAWQPWKAARLTTLGSLAVLPFFTTYKAINNIANGWQPWLAALAVFEPVWQPSRSRLQGCQRVLRIGSVGRVGGGDLAEHGEIGKGRTVRGRDTNSKKQDDATYILARLRRDK